MCVIHITYEKLNDTYFNLVKGKSLLLFNALERYTPFDPEARDVYRRFSKLTTLPLKDAPVTANAQQDSTTLTCSRHNLFYHMNEKTINTLITYYGNPTPLTYYVGKSNHILSYKLAYTLQDFFDVYFLDYDDIGGEYLLIPYADVIFDYGIHTECDPTISLIEILNQPL